MYFVATVALLAFDHQVTNNKSAPTSGYFLLTKILENTDSLT